MNDHKHDEQLINRYRELADRSAGAGIYTYSDFHSPHSAALAYGVTCDKNVSFWGGAENCERVIVRFGDPEETGYEEDYPIRIIHIFPKQAKYADKLTHRDYLGAIMNLGLERDVIGDILMNDAEAYVFVCERIAEYIVDELTQIKHTSVRCEAVSEIPDGIGPKLTEESVTVSSVRLDGIIAKIWHLSRTEAKSLFSSEEVFVNGRLCVNASYEPKPEDVVSVRGHGKFIYAGIERKTSKDRFAVLVRRYV